jgi:hypothetical protein
MSSSRLAVIALLGVTALAPAAAPASRQAPPRLLSITPSIVDAVARPGTALVPMAVANSTPVTFRIRVYPALVHQRLDGSLVIRERRRDLAAARRLFAVAPGRFVLRPGRSASLTQLFVRTAHGRPGAYAATVVEAAPPRSKTGGAAYRVRLLGALLVTKPNAPAPRGRVESLRVARIGQRMLSFCYRVANTGRVHGYPEGMRLRVERAGRAIFQAAPRRGVVLPGYRREFGVRLFRDLPAGRYTVKVGGRFGKSTVRASTQFSVGGRKPLKPFVGATACAAR